MTLGEFREATKDIPDNATLTIVHDSNFLNPTRIDTEFHEYGETYTVWIEADYD